MGGGISGDHQKLEVGVRSGSSSARRLCIAHPFEYYGDSFVVVRLISDWQMRVCNVVH